MQNWLSMWRTILIHLLIFQTVWTPHKTTRMWWGSRTGSRLTSSSTWRTQMSFPTFTSIWKEEWSKKHYDRTTYHSFFRYMYLVKNCRLVFFCVLFSRSAILLSSGIVILSAAMKRSLTKICIGTQNWESARSGSGTTWTASASSSSASTGTWLRSSTTASGPRYPDPERSHEQWCIVS